MHNPEFVLEKDTHKLFWDLAIQTDHLILVRQPELVRQQKKRTCRMVDLAVLADHRVKLNEGKKERYIPGPCKRMEKKTMECEGDSDTNCNWCAWYSHQRIGTETGGVRINRTNGDHPNYSIADSSQNAKKSSGDLRRLAVTHSSVKPSANSHIRK